MQPPRPPRDPKPPRKPRPSTPRAKSPSAVARDQRRAEQHAADIGKPTGTKRPAAPKEIGRPERAPPRRGAERVRRPAVPREVEKPGAPQRIAKLLARAGVASRREIERMIEERRIAIDGVPIETPATVLTSLRNVTV